MRHESKSVISHKWPTLRFSKTTKMRPNYINFVGWSFFSSMQACLMLFITNVEAQKFSFKSESAHKGQCQLLCDPDRECICVEVTGLCAVPKLVDIGILDREAEHFVLVSKSVCQLNGHFLHTSRVRLRTESAPTPSVAQDRTAMPWHLRDGRWHSELLEASS